MKVYSIHRNSGGGPVPELVPEGLNVAALVFGPLWAAWHGLWWTAAGLTVSLVAIRGAGFLLQMTADQMLAGVTALLVIFAAEANDIRRRALERHGRIELGLVSGRNRREAEIRALARLGA
jgi:hypothetical protein